MARRIQVEILGDERSLSRAFGRASRDATTFNNRLTETAVTVQKTSGLLRGLDTRALLAGAAGGAGFAAITAGTEALTAFVREGVLGAAQLQASGRAIDQTFGDAGDRLKEFAHTSAAEFGISAVASEQLDARFGILFKNLGIGADQAAVMTENLQLLAGSIAKIRGVDPATLLEKLPLVLAGNLRGIKALGFALTQQQIKQEAVRLGLIQQRDVLDSTSKAVAIYTLITAKLDDRLKLADAHSGDLAAQQHKLKAEAANAADSLGKLLLPPLTSLVGVLAQAAEGTSTLIDELSHIGDVNIPFFGHAKGLFKDFGRSFVTALDPGLAVLQKIGAFEEKKHKISIAVDIASNDFSALDLLTGKKQPKRINAFGQPGFKPGGAPPVPLGVSAAQRNTIFDAAIGRAQDRVQDVKSLQGQITALQKISGLITQRLAITKDATRRLTLEGQLLDIARQVAADRQAASDAFWQTVQESDQFRLERAQATATLKDDIKAFNAINASLKAQIAATGNTIALQRQLFENNEALRQAQIQQRQNAQFRALGFGPGGTDLVPSTKRLKLELARIGDVVKDTFLDTSKTRSLIAQIRKLLAGGLGALTADVRQKIQDLLTGIDRQLKQHEGTRTKFHLLDTDKFFSGLGLSNEQLKAARSRLAQVGPGGTVPTRGSGAFGIGFPVVVHTTVNLDGQKVATNTTKHQQRRARGTVAQRNGRNAGVAMGLG